MTLIKDTRSTIRLVALAIIAGASTLVMLQTEEDTDDSPPVPQLGLAYFMKSAELRGTGPDGKILYRLNADRAEQQPDNDFVTLENISLSYEPSADVPWDAFADTGSIPPGGTLVELEGNVLIMSKKPDSAQVTIRTSKLDLLPSEKKAITDRKVIIEREGQKVHGTGMEARLDRSEVSLLSNVNGKYLP